MTDEPRLADATIDVRGTLCPMNWVRAKLRLEKMAIGDRLAVWVDDQAALANIPKSARQEGHLVVDVRLGEGYYEIVIERGKQDFAKAFFGG
ncbi:MAG TPA: sulfurtransferase TusA family protein [bacterium]|nr:sulfurtransferase TusA family protein [bacterium]